MNRRSFISLIVGGVAGAFAPSKVESVSSSIRRSGMQCLHTFDTPIKDMTCFQDQFFILLENGELWQLYSPEDLATHVCHCPKPGDTVMCNYPKCSDYDPGNAKPYEDKYIS